MSRRRDWLRTHRRVIVGVLALLLGIFVPIPGYVAASFLWSAGVHDLETTGEAVAFACVVVSVSAVVWGALANALLPRSHVDTSNSRNA
jgi:hypothetical protein